MEQAVRRDSSLGLLTRALRRHLLLVMVVALVGVAGAVAYAHSNPVRYTASATVLPRPLLGNTLGPDTLASSGTQLTVAMQTEAGLVATPAVATLATKSLGTQVPRLEDSVSAKVPPNTQIISITYRSNSAMHAQQGAQAFAEAFLRYRENVGLAAQRQTLESLGKQRAIALAALKIASAAVIPGSDPRSFASQRELLYSNQLATLQNRISSTEALSTSPGIVVTSASLPTAADGLPRYVIVLFGTLLAFVLGVVLAAARERRRDLVDTATELDVCGLPLLASLPRRAFGAVRLVSGHAAADGLPEAYRRMRAGLIAVSGTRKVFLVSSLSPAADSGAIAVNLGICLAQAAFRVTVVAADAGQETAELMLDAASSPGLADVLMDRANLDETLQDLHGIKFLAAGSDVADARERYAGPALKAVIESVRRDSDFVFVAAAVVSTSEADSVSLVCDGAVLVVTESVSTQVETAAAIDHFGRLQLATVGAVSVSANDPDDGHADSSTVVASEGGSTDKAAAPLGRKPSRRPTPGLGTDR